MSITGNRMAKQRRRYKAFFVGDMVQWQSAPNGKKPKKKIGEVIAIVPAGFSPENKLERWRKANDYREKLRPQFLDESKRDYESYLVLVVDKVYWPYVKGLEVVG